MTSKPVINYMLCIGFRCLTVDTMKKHGWRKFTGPFDEMYIDIETVFETISTNFESYLTDIVEYNQAKSSATLHFPKNTQSLNPEINSLQSKPIGYLAHNYFRNTNLINQNYIQTNNSGNFYDWSRICVFNHQPLLQPDVYTKLQRRIERARELFNKHSQTLLLFGMSRIVSTSLETYIQQIVERKRFYKIPYRLCMIIFTDKPPGRPFDEIEECLFLYHQCYEHRVHYIWSKNGIYADNNGADLTPQIDYIQTYYDLNLLDKNTLSI